jgi:predicted protein tyrosine phosphatase
MTRIFTADEIARHAPAAATRKTGAVHVCPLSEVPSLVADVRASRLVSLLQAEIPVPTPVGIAADSHLRLEVHDIAEPLLDHVAPAREHVRSLLDFAEAWGGEGVMVVHCWAGISRSTAAAFTALCLVNPDVPELVIARALRAASPTAQPNRLIVQHADDLMGRKGRMLCAVEAMGPAVRAYAARPFSLSADPVRLAKAG